MISKEEIFSIQNDEQFQEIALKIFQFQAEHNSVYNQFLHYLGVDQTKIQKVEKIPFLPIRFFKEFDIISGNKKPEKIFTSSGTTGSVFSKHFVTDLSVYRESLMNSFHQFYGEFKDYTIFALLPSYLEREGSSLIDMVKYWIEQSGRGGFYLYNHKKLFEDLQKNENSGQKAILIGVSFALLDFVEKYSINLENTIVMETGGMKGRRQELTREQLHKQLKRGFSVQNIHSEYGMTELLSQAYSKGNSKFQTPNWMQVKIRDTEDPLSLLPMEKTGGVNIIDLANVNSCSFIATDDLGKVYADGSFEILGRFDNSDVRGCNLIVADV